MRREHSAFLQLTINNSDSSETVEIVTHFQKISFVHARANAIIKGWGLIESAPWMGARKKLSTVLKLASDNYNFKKH